MTGNPVFFSVVIWGVLIMAIASHSIRPAAWQALVEGKKQLLVIGGPESRLIEGTQSDEWVRFIRADNESIPDEVREVERAAVVMFVIGVSEVDRRRIGQVAPLCDVQCIKLVQKPEDIESFVQEVRAQAGRAPVRPSDENDATANVVDSIRDDGEDDEGYANDPALDEGAVNDRATRINQALEVLVDELPDLLLAADPARPAELASAVQRLESERNQLQAEVDRLGQENRTLFERVQELEEQWGRVVRLTQTEQKP